MPRSYVGYTNEDVIAYWCESSVVDSTKMLLTPRVWKRKKDIYYDCDIKKVRITIEEVTSGH